MMIHRADYRLMAVVLVAGIVALAPFVVPRAQGFVRQNSCAAPPELTKFDRPLSRTARLLAADKPVKIVTFGSSSTAGAGATTPATNYPSRLEVEMRERFPLRTINVVNRGVGGTEMPEMIARMDENLPADKPDLVIWQLGTNSLLRDH